MSPFHLMSAHRAHRRTLVFASVSVLGAVGAVGAVRALGADTGASARVSQQAPDTTVVLRTTGSNLEFEPNRIALRQGTRVRIRFVNDGTLPHNLVVPREEEDIDALAAAAVAAGSKTGYIPLDMQDKLFGFSTLASPGQSTELSITVPAPGEYRFVCLYPGHQNSMIGTLRSLK
jgi:uncharacterized cupredoxin-like copper-binding protein